jgi:hypothetical protein
MNRETPRWAEELVTQAGGKNIFGLPWYRLVWGHSRLAFNCGLWEDRDASMRLIRAVFEVRKVPKYPAKLDRWHLEVWLPPWKYGTPESWEQEQKLFHPNSKMISLLNQGPYPSRGDYESLFVIETRAGGFKQLTRPVVSLVCDIVSAHRKASREERWAAERKAAEDAAAARDRQMENVIHSAQDLPFGGRPSNASPHELIGMIREERQHGRPV